MGDYAAALARLEEALAMPSLARNPKKLAYALHSLANVHRGMGNLEATLASLRRADENAAYLLPIQRSFHLTSIAHIELQQGRIDGAIQTYREAIELSRRARHAEGLAQSLRTLGEVLFELGKHDEALPYLREAADLFAQLEDARAEAEMWRARRPRMSAMGSARRIVGSVGTCAVAVAGGWAIRRDSWSAGRDRASAPSHPRSDRRECVGVRGGAGPGVDARRTAPALACRNTLGILEWARGRYADALAHYEAALLLSREDHDPAQEGLILNSLGVTLSKLNRPEEARTVLEESVALNRQTGRAAPRGARARRSRTRVTYARSARSRRRLLRAVPRAPPRRGRRHRRSLDVAPDRRDARRARGRSSRRKMPPPRPLASRPPAATPT